ncbi:MAG: excinuclease ABC subunit UvrA [Opitutales bacterium]
MSADKPQVIRLQGIRQNNLKGFDLDLPLGHLIVVTGLSGSGKSSLVFETIHAEHQRRNVETFSPHTPQFHGKLYRTKSRNLETIRPSIAIEQTNTVKTSRSTVGTMTELTDFFKVWFAQAARLRDPVSGKIIEDDNPQSIWTKAQEAFPGQAVLLGFPVTRPGKLGWAEILKSLGGQGYTRCILAGEVIRIENLNTKDITKDAELVVLQDRLNLAPNNRSRFLEAAETALHFGRGHLVLADRDGETLARYAEGLHSPETGETYRPATANLFSFNSPLGACPECRGFGRVIEIDDRLVIPDHSLSIADGAIRPFQGNVYSESLKDLMRAARRHGVPTDVPWGDLSAADRAFVMDGEAGYQEGQWMRQWYGVRRFFDWLQSNTYKMHVRVFLSKYRSYVTCPACGGARLQPESLLWRWEGYRLPDLYRMPVDQLHGLLEARATPNETDAGDPETFQANLALQAIRTRLDYLNQVGLGYLTLDRSSRTLSGGETERVNLTACLGTSLVDTLFVLDEPSIGLHARDIDRLTRILRRLTDLGNTVVVVEHDEAIMRAADTILEIGPEPGSRGGHLTFAGSAEALTREATSLTGAYLSGRQGIPLPAERRKVGPAGGGNWATPSLGMAGIHCHNLRGVDLRLPLQRLVCVSGVSGSGKSTLLNNALYQGLQAEAGRAVEEPAAIESIDHGLGFSEVVLVDQAPISRTPRSNPALYTDAWDAIRDLFAVTEAARERGFTPGTFSFNAGDGRCDHCSGLGYEKVEMQFLSDVFVPCPVCNGRRFKPEVLAIRWRDKTVDDILALDVRDALAFFGDQPKVAQRLKSLEAVGLGYLTLGQPLNTLSGGESQRLKLVKYLSRFGETGKHALILLDEPTTGLHRHDIRRLLAVLQELVDQGHSVVVIEHQTDVLAAADWIIEMGPDAGDRGGRIVAAGPPERIAETDTETARFVAGALAAAGDLEKQGEAMPALAAEDTQPYAAPGQRQAARPDFLQVRGAREHNLKNLTVSIPHRELTVVTGVSGSGKSSLAFDIVFAEGQRRFLESMSAYARQFVEQLPKPDIDGLEGIAPTVAIEQRVTRGSRKSTVATITEVAQYLRLLFARAGIQHNPETGRPVLPMSVTALKKRFREVLDQPVVRKARHAYLCAPLIRGRKGHHQPLANWAADHGFKYLRCDGAIVPVDGFKKLDRYREHDVEVLVADVGKEGRAGHHRVTGLPDEPTGEAALDLALRLGKGSAFIATPLGEVLAWFSTTRVDPETGEAFPELDPKHFSWNSSRGWCPTCRGHGRIYDWMADREDAPEGIEAIDHGALCPDCDGTRLNRISRAVRLPLRGDRTVSLPELLALPPAEVLKTLKQLKLDKRGKAIAAEIIPQAEERLAFMDRVGIEYLTLDRATSTLSGGEAQRIRLAAQLGSNLSGVLYVLDEPSIGLHAADNARLIRSLHALRDKGNTLLVVEHDDDTMRAADRIIDLGPGAGVHGGEILADGSWSSLMDNPKSLTGQYLRTGIPHPINGSYRKLPGAWNPRSSKTRDAWLVAKGTALRNLKGDDLRLPINRLIGICGVSGAGKSTLIRDLLLPAVRHAAKAGQRRITGKALLEAGALPEADPAASRLPLAELVNGDPFKAAIEVDQSPIGKTPRSTPATYMGAFDLIREIFATLPEARMRGYTAGTFSFNTKGGRCETCSGAGRVKLEMNFLPDTYVRCDDCHGRRYGPELEDIQWNGKSIADVMRMTFEEAAAFFDFHSRLKAMLGLMVETGLGYLRLGQSSPTLSGGEAQRLKLVSELAKGLQTYKERSHGIQPRNLYVLEEPTIGLHLSDCERLIQLLHRLVDQGHTVIVIEHQLDVLAEADYLVEVGPGGGQARGGRILYQGNVAGLLKRKSSPTARFLAEKVKG